MSSFDLITGWVAAALFGVALLSSLVNRSRLKARLSFSMGWFRAHNWLGAVATVAGVAHCLASITRSTLPVGEEIGIWAGAAAVGLLVLTAFAGSGLSGAKRDARRRIRRNHVATMFAVLVVGIVHTALNGPLAGR
jgi:hypothetical protein